MTNSEFPTEFQAEKPRKAYTPPTVTLLEDSEIEGGDTNVPEANDGVLES